MALGRQRSSIGTPSDFVLWRQRSRRNVDILADQANSVGWRDLREWRRAASVLDAILITMPRAGQTTGEETAFASGPP